LYITASFSLSFSPFVLPSCLHYLIMRQRDYFVRINVFCLYDFCASILNTALHYIFACILYLIYYIILMPLDYKLMQNLTEVQTNKPLQELHTPLAITTLCTCTLWNKFHTDTKTPLETQDIYIWIDNSDTLFYCILFKSLAPSHHYILTHHTSITIKDNHH